MAKINFQSSQYETEDASRFDPLPSGKYHCTIEAEAVKETKAGNGSYLELTLVVMDGPYSRRKVFDRINLKNPNEQAETIGRRRLATICTCFNIENLTDTSQLLGRNIIVSVGIEKDKVTGQLTNRNVVYGYLPVVPNVRVQPSTLDNNQGLNHLGQPKVQGVNVGMGNINQSISDDPIPF